MSWTSGGRNPIPEPWRGPACSLLPTSGVRTDNYNGATPISFCVDIPICAQEFTFIGCSLYFCGDKSRVLVAAFDARIVEVVERPDGTPLRYVIEAINREGWNRRVEVKVEAFRSMRWLDMLGEGFEMAGGKTAEGRLLMVIQMIARINPPRRVVEVDRLGWFRLGDEWLYAHGAGAIGASGPVPSVRAELIGRLRAYGLPDPPDDPDALRAALVRFLRIRFLSLDGRTGTAAAASVALTLPLRAVFSRFNASVHLGGTTGVKKSAGMARVIWKCFAGSPGRECSLPAGVGSTPRPACNTPPTSSAIRCS